MSTNAPQVQQPQDDPWIPKRVHGGLRHVRRVGRGKNRHYEFHGQEPGEVVRMPPIRKHKIFLIPPALPLLGTILALIGVLVLDLDFSSASPLWAFLALIFGILFLATGAYFVYKDFLLWWTEVVIITNKRIMIMTWKGLSLTYQQVPLDKIVQEGVEQKSLWSLLFSYGDVHLYVTGGPPPVLKRIPNPKKVRDNFERVREEVRQGQKPPEPHPEPESPDLKQVLTKLAQPDPLPVLPNPDAKYADRHRPGGFRRPLRTFGGPLRLPCDVHYTTDENTVMYIQRSKYVLALKLSLPILVLLATIVLTLYFPYLFPYTAFAILAILLWIGLTIINYYDDVFILTNKRIIDIERRLVILDEEHKITEYGQIKELNVKISNPIFLILGVGDVIVETPGNNPNIELTRIDHPFFIQDKIIELKGLKEKIDKIKAKNDLKTELNKWFGTVLDTMEKTVLGRGVPNLQTLDLFAAAERAREFGMKVVPVGEDPSYPNIDSGHIVAQNPLPGTLMQVDSNDPEHRPQIQVILSKRP